MAGAKSKEEILKDLEAEVGKLSDAYKAAKEVADEKRSIHEVKKTARGTAAGLIQMLQKEGLSGAVPPGQMVAAEKTVEDSEKALQAAKAELEPAEKAESDKRKELRAKQKELVAKQIAYNTEAQTGKQAEITAMDATASTDPSLVRRRAEAAAELDRLKKAGDEYLAKQKEYQAEEAAESKKTADALKNKSPLDQLADGQRQERKAIDTKTVEELSDAYKTAYDKWEKAVPAEKDAAEKELMKAKENYQDGLKEWLGKTFAELSSSPDVIRRSESYKALKDIYSVLAAGKSLEGPSGSKLLDPKTVSTITDHVKELKDQVTELNAYERQNIEIKKGLGVGDDGKRHLRMFLFGDKLVYQAPQARGFGNAGSILKEDLRFFASIVLTPFNFLWEKTAKSTNKGLEDVSGVNSSVRNFVGGYGVTDLVRNAWRSAIREHNKGKEKDDPGYLYYDANRNVAATKDSKGDGKVCDEETFKKLLPLLIAELNRDEFIVDPSDLQKLLEHQNTLRLKDRLGEDVAFAPPSSPPSP